MEIGEKIRRARTHKRLSLRKLGASLGVTGSAIHQWENGNVTNITLAHRIALSEHLDMPIADLLPPEATGKDVTVRDPREKLLIQRFREAPEQRRELYLRLLLVMEEEAANRDQPGSDGPPR